MGERRRGLREREWVQIKELGTDLQGRTVWRREEGKEESRKGPLCEK